MLDGAEIRSQVIDVSSDGIQVGFDAGLELRPNQVLRATLIWQRLSVAGTFEIRHVNESFGRGAVAGGVFAPDNPAVFRTFVLAASDKLTAGDGGGA